MSIENLNSAAWAAGFALAPTEEEAIEAFKAATEKTRIATKSTAASRWQSAKVPGQAVARLAPAGSYSGMRHWLTHWQRKATA